MEIRKLSNVSNELGSKTQSSSLSTISTEAALSELIARPAIDTIVVGEVVVHRSENDLYSLNDLHKASGGEEATKPYRFLEVAKNATFVKSLQALTPDTPVLVTVKGGANPGTWGSEEVAYKYASWISDDFDILVMSTFKKVVRKEVEWVHKANLEITDKHIKTLGQLQKAHKENQDSMLIIRTMEQSVSRLKGNVPKSVADYFGLQKRNLVEASLALENAHGAILSVYEDAHSIIHGVKVKLTQDMSKHWRDFLTNDLLNPLQDMASHLNTKLGEVSEDLTRAREYRVGGSKHFGKQES